MPRADHGWPEQAPDALGHADYLLEVLVLVSLLAAGLHLAGQRAHGRLKDAVSNSDR